MTRMLTNHAVCGGIAPFYFIKARFAGLVFAALKSQSE